LGVLSCELFFPVFLWLVISLFVDSETALFLTGYGILWVPFGVLYSSFFGVSWSLLGYRNVNNPSSSLTPPIYTSHLTKETLANTCTGRTPREGNTDQESLEADRSPALQCSFSPVKSLDSNIYLTCENTVYFKRVH
jgi:hypothetical protein